MTTDATVQQHLDGIENPQKREDCQALAELMQGVTGEAPVMWGSGIVGFGKYHYKYASGREGDWMIVGFAARKAELSLYGLLDAGPDPQQLEKLGKHKTGKGCLYVKKLSDVDLDVLKDLIRAAYELRRDGYQA